MLFAPWVELPADFKIKTGKGSLFVYHNGTVFGYLRVCIEGCEEQLYAQDSRVEPYLRSSFFVVW